MTQLIAGVDEVGRGAWAGPIVAAAVILHQPIIGLKDSKTLSRAVREKLAEIIQANCIAYAISEVSSSIIDELGIAEANRLVMRQAISKLEVLPTLVRIDGFSCGTDILEEVYIKGDAIYLEISAASIIAKVYRDNLMRRMHLQYPNYGFDRHVGYGTREHRVKLTQFGLTLHHRRSFRPIQKVFLVKG